MRPPRRHRSRAALRNIERGETIKTIVIALVANVVIAVAKLAAGVVTRSSGLLAEAAHSFADSVNEVLLAIAVRRAQEPPDETHPLGHGREQFLWALMAAIATFLIGGCFSVAMAIYRLREGGDLERPLVAWIVIGVSFVADGISWLQSVSQARNEAKEEGHPLRRQLLRSSDPTVRAVFFEDTVALLGLLIASAGLLISTMTHSSAPDSVASLIIGILLAFTAFGLAWPLADFLVGRSLAPEYVEKLRKVITSSPAVHSLVSLQAVYIGPKEAIVAAKIRPLESMDAGEIARAMDDLDAALREASPYVSDVYLDITL